MGAEILNVAEFFFMTLALGIGLFTWIASPKLTGAGFQKLINSVCLGSVSIGFLIHLSYGTLTDPVSRIYYIAIAAFFLIRQLHKDEKTIFMWVLFVVHNLAMLYLLMDFQNGWSTQYRFGLSSAILNGIITYAMILGHYYLVVPKLSEKPLKICVLILWAILAIKVVWSSYETYQNWGFFKEFTQLGGGYAFNWLMLTMRVGWGYVVIFAMSIFTWKLVKIRSTQSATGVLYAMTIFVFVGELVSAYLYFKYGLLI
ncbi:hypothetical protein BIY24_15050 [Halobacteriovorax marinus]|uniref:Membrane protein n=1 Tax=Halobacteriovorax marinus (strain ATCC BAA-682 / DSM 15412 / SJ) TaxID=862908 RepID=E1X004_HALMS|nr:hypothetical protein [Halobacteriovorax marinus]ATH09212.1 hypothetical protein BIY24_15050 [Halobacteriovorax marinus]CBW27940.1 putative membrane protein [Halobacteriovorax marinus SJ]